MITSYFKSKKKPEGVEKVELPSNENGKKHQRHDNDDDDDDVDNKTTKRSKYNDISKKSSMTTKHAVISKSKSTSSASSSPEVTELMSNLTDDSWNIKLNEYTSRPSFRNLAKFVAKERVSQTVYPPPCDVFSALNSLPVDKVKVVIVGQDPYHQPNQGHGLAFSVRKGIRIPPSLRNIYKELLNNTKKNPDCGFDVVPKHGYLEQWCSQGVLLLNAVLTVRRSDANSHAKKGWEDFTDEIIKILLNHAKSSNSKLVFLLWGKPASKKAESIINRYGGRGRHVIISTSHPSPLGATKTNAPFIGSDCFNRANDALIKMDKSPISWKIDE